MSSCSPLLLLHGRVAVLIALDIPLSGSRLCLAEEPLPDAAAVELIKKGLVVVEAAAPWKLLSSGYWF